jgi:hypothetical protein
MIILNMKSQTWQRNHNYAGNVIFGYTLNFKKSESEMRHHRFQLQKYRTSSFYLE